MTNNTFKKLKENPKFRKNSIAIGSAALIVIMAGVSIPLVVHNNNVKKEIAAAVTTTTESTTLADETTTVPETTTLPDGIETTIFEENGTTLIAGVTDQNGEFVYTTIPTTHITEVPAETKAPSNNNTTKKASSGSSSSGNKNSGSSSSGTKSTTKAPTTKAPVTEAPTEAEVYWTRERAEAMSQWMIQYGESIGLKYDPSMNQDNSSWQGGPGARDGDSGTGAGFVNEEKFKERAIDDLQTEKKLGATRFNIDLQDRSKGNGPASWEWNVLWMR